MPNLPEVTTSIAGSIAIGGMALDAYGHNLVEHTPNLVARAQLAQIPFIGEWASENTGNIVYSVGPVIVMTALAEVLHAAAEYYDMPSLHKVANATEIGGYIFSALANVIAETVKHGELFLPRNDQFVPDIATALAMMGFAGYAIHKLTRNALQSRINQNSDLGLL